MSEQPVGSGAERLAALGEAIRTAAAAGGGSTCFVATVVGQPAAAAAAAIAGALGFADTAGAAAAGVTVGPLFGGVGGAVDLSRYLRIRLPLDLATDAAYDAAYALRAAAGAVRVDPDLPATVMHPPASELMPGFRAALSGPEPGPPPPDPAWHLRAMRIPEAWALPPGPGGQSKGAGVVIAQPDTGYAPHGDIDMGDYDLAHDLNLLDGSDDARDTLGPELAHLRYPGHGTSTASVAVTLRPRATPAPAESTPGLLQPLFDFLEAVVDTIVGWIQRLLGGGAGAGASLQPEPDGLPPGGVAPEAKVIPIRCTDTVFITLGTRLAEAIRYAADQEEVGVIMMSLGGLPTPWLEAAVSYAALDKGCIVVAAAGQPFPPVVAPAVYPYAAAAAATDSDDRPWPDSARGEAVAVSAPGVAVWRASFDRHGGMAELFQPGTGTSFAAACLGGVAALWLAHHGRGHLVSVYQEQGIPLQEVFVRLVRETARRPDSWTPVEQALYGQGIVDARALLAAPLPPASDFLPAAAWQPTSDAALLAHLGAAFWPEDDTSGDDGPTAAHAVLAAVLETTADTVRALADDFGGELIRHLYEQMAAGRPTAALAGAPHLSAALRAAMAAGEAGDA